MKEKKLGFAGIVVALAGSLAGCSGILLEKADKNPSSPPDGGFAFSLRTSSILLTGEAPKAAPGDTGGTAKAAIPSTKVDCADKLTQDCAADVARITATATPISDTSAVYFARPASNHPHLGGTTLAPKNDPTDPLMIQSVAFSYKNEVPNIIAGAGAGAVAGLAFGPAGLWVGLAIGAGGASVSQVSAPDWAQAAVCRSDLPKMARAYSPKKDSLAASPAKELSLPVVLDYPLTDETPPRCWHTLPAVKGAGSTSKTNAGWFYRILPVDAAPAHQSAVPPVLAKLTLDDPLPEVFRRTGDYFSEAGSKRQQTFPVSGCRAVAVELAWWEDLQTNKNPEPPKDLVETIQLTIADPRVVQVMSIGGADTTIALLPCGAYATAGQPSTQFADDVSALVKQVQAIRSAQQPKGK